MTTVATGWRRRFAWLPKLIQEHGAAGRRLVWLRVYLERPYKAWSTDPHGMNIYSEIRQRMLLDGTRGDVLINQAWIRPSDLEAYKAWSRSP